MGEGKNFLDFSFYLFQVSLLLTWYFLLQLPQEALLNHVLDAPGLSDWFCGAVEAGNPDALFLALKIREKTSLDNAVFGKLLPNPFCPNKLFSAEHLSSLASCLKVILICVCLFLS